jgi:hypothetical protein
VLVSHLVNLPWLDGCNDVLFVRLMQIDDPLALVQQSAVYRELPSKRLVLLSDPFFHRVNHMGADDDGYAFNTKHTELR